MLIMKNLSHVFIPVALSVLIIAGCFSRADHCSVASPDGRNIVNLYIDSAGAPGYYIVRDGKVIIDSSGLGFEISYTQDLKEGGIDLTEEYVDLTKNFRIMGIVTNSGNRIWELPWGEQREVKDSYNEITYALRSKAEPGLRLNIIFRAYNDGVAFRYRFPQVDNADSVIIKKELSKFKLTVDHMCWWIPGDYDSYEHLYNTGRFSKIDAKRRGDGAPGLGHTVIPYNAVNTPITMKSSDGVYLSFHEAALVDYAGMTLKVDTINLSMISELVGSDRLGYKVKRSLPFDTPWRTIQIADKAVELLESKLILNLNEPNKLGDVEWVKPMKYVGIWWDMHIERATWDYSSGRHGATTEHAIKYIDFAAANGFGGVLIEGWNVGWEHWIGFEDREGVFDFVTPYPDYDLKRVAAYAASKGVKIIMHHETSAAPRTYDKQIDTAYALMKSLGIDVVKTGYVGKIIPKGEYHHGQWMVNHYNSVIQKAAQNRISVNVHEPIKPTGLRRTYPNLLSGEGVRGQEFNAWCTDGGNPPEHISIVAYTRMLAGPIDFTPGVFDIALPTKPNNQINTTLAQQLALYVVILSPIQMACDLPENYYGNKAFEFIKEVAVNWDRSLALDGEIGDFVIIARKERGTDRWFVGGVTDENERMANVKFNYLDSNKRYLAKIYRDGVDAHYSRNPKDISIEEIEVTSSTILNIKMEEGGGFAITLTPLSSN